ncbi:GntR family transcriptional regulator [soil metagenome]
MTVGPVPRQAASLHQQVTESLRDAILDGRLKPGQKLVERELCSLLEISRTLLREALQQLRGEGLITSELHKGPSVAIIGVEEVTEIYEIRQALEALAGRAFARKATDEQVRNLRHQLEILKQPEAAQSPRDLLIAKSGFYQVLFEGSGNRVVSSVLTQLNNRMMLYKRLSLSSPGRLPETLRELEGIVAAIEARDPDRTAILCAAHVANAATTVLRQLNAEENSKTHLAQEDHGRENIRERA